MNDDNDAGVRDDESKVEECQEQRSWQRVFFIFVDTKNEENRCKNLRSVLR